LEKGKTLKRGVLFFFLEKRGNEIFVLVEQLNNLQKERKKKWYSFGKKGKFLLKGKGRGKKKSRHFQ
jgi:hypothetical protein